MLQTLTAAPPFESTTGDDAHAVLDGLVRSLGSTLDADDLAERSLEALRDLLGLHHSAFFVLDSRGHEARRRGPGREGELDRWAMGADFERALATPSPMVALGERMLAPVSPRFTHALRLLDGEALVGFVLLEPEIRGELDPARQRLLQTMGRMIGSSLARALVHQTLTDVTSRLDGVQRLQQHILDHVSHEFNTPLMILRSSAEFAKDADDEERALFFDMHSQALDRLEELVRGVLEIARSRARLELRQIDAKDLVRAIVEPVIESHDWPADKVRRWLRVSSPANAMIDPDAMHLVVEHLVRNAWSYAGEQGSPLGVAVYPHTRSEWRRSSSEQRLDAYLAALSGSERSPLPSPQSTPDVLVIEFADAGIGVPADEMDLVFEPFTQASNSPLKGVSGAGMGLPTCRKRVEDLQGELRMVSREGEGTVVSILLPLCRRVDED